MISDGNYKGYLIGGDMEYCTEDEQYTSTGEAYLSQCENNKENEIFQRLQAFSGKVFAL